MSDGWLRDLGIDRGVVGSDFPMSSFLLVLSSSQDDGWYVQRYFVILPLDALQRSDSIVDFFNPSAFDRAELRDVVNFFIHSLSFHVLLDLMSYVTFLSRAGYLIMKKCFTVND